MVPIPAMAPGAPLARVMGRGLGNTGRRRKASPARWRSRQSLRNESSRADFYSRCFMERRCVLGSSVWSTRSFARWAAG
jgi:hypothetical protein